MTTVQALIECPQCGYTETDCLYYCHDGSSYVVCRRCGYEERDGPVFADNGETRGWKNEVSHGAGYLWYKPIDGSVFAGHPLHSADHVASAELWLREELKNGGLDVATAYLTSWDHETKQVKMVLGSFYSGPQNSEQ